MIRRLRRRMTLLVIGVLIIVSVGIVLGIYYVNNRNIETQAETTLEILADRQGGPPALPGPDEQEGTPPPIPGERMEDDRTPPPIPEEKNGEERTTPDRRGQEEDSETRPQPEGERMMVRPDPGAGRDGRGRIMSGEEVASLSNSYTMTLDAAGQITAWESERMDLYSQEILQNYADQILQQEKTKGRIGTQFYRILEQEDGSRMAVVLDARLELMAGQRVLQVTALVAGAACLLLSIGAWLLIRRMVAPVEESFRRQQQFVWDASHELKTPLAVISANAEVLERETGPNEYLDYIVSEVRRTDSLVKNLLALARMDRGTAEQQKRMMNLSEAVTEVLLPFESTVFEAGKTLNSDGVQEGVMVNGNESMLQQLTVILLSNALKYSDEHGTITVRLARKNRGAELRVENTGRGIEPENLERIFDRFYRTDASRNSETGGEGLGLAIARSIVDLHPGKIRAESEPGKNAVFIVNLP